VNRDAGLTGRNEDDLTNGLSKVIESNKQLKVAMDKGQGIDCFKVCFAARSRCKVVDDLADAQGNWETLTFTAALYINSQAPGIKQLQDVSVVKQRGICSCSGQTVPRSRATLEGKAGSIPRKFVR
jgi:hypothetical protein